MKILLVSSIYPPDIGGPATYCFALEKGLKERGLEVDVAIQSKARTRLGFFLSVFKKARKADLIYSFNLVSCGLPAFLACLFLRKKLIARTGGDYLWERATQRDKTILLLREFYQGHLTIKERFLKFLQKIILKKTSKIIFTTDLQKNVYLEYFDLPANKVVVIANPFPKTSLPTQIPAIFTIVYAGRLIRFKNLDFVISALAEIENQFLFKIIGSGPQKESLQKQVNELGLESKVAFQEPMPRRRLLREIAKSSLPVLIAKEEISPNFILEGLALGKPVLLTKECGLKKDILDKLILVKPNDKQDLKAKLLFLMDKTNYNMYLEKIKQIDKTWSWGDVVAEHIKLFKGL